LLRSAIAWGRGDRYDPVVGIRIRPAEPEDVPLIAELIRGLAEYEHLTDALRMDERALAEHLFGARRYVEVLLADVDGQTAGYALFFHTYSTFLTKPGIWLEDIFVVPAHRRHGVGHALFERLATIAVERGCGRLEWSVLEWNEPALAFYRGLGAGSVDGWTMYRLAGAALERLAAAPSSR
jgi:GNAT superfamily N-acetyltransferase